MAEGRGYVTTDDVRAMVHDGVRHRLILSCEANADSISADQVVDTSIELFAVPA